MGIIKLSIPPFIGVEFSIGELESFRAKFGEKARRLFQPKDKHQDFVGCYYIIAKHSRKCLDVKDGSPENCANVWQYDLHKGENQQWILVKAKDDYYHVFAKHSGKCLDVERYSTDDGANVWQYAFHGSANQQWELRNAEAGYFHLIARNSGKALDVERASHENCANVFQYQLHGGDNQKWKLVPVA